MLSIWAILILFVEVVNPVLFAFLVYAASIQKLVLNSPGNAAGAYTGLPGGRDCPGDWARIPDRAAEKPTDDRYVIELTIAVLLLVIAYCSLTKTETNSKQKQPSDYGILTPGKQLGSVPWSISSEFHSLCPISQRSIRSSKLICLFLIRCWCCCINCLYAVPFLIVPLVSLLLG